MIVRASALSLLLLGGCTTAGARGPSEFDRHAADCHARGGVLTPIQGASTGRAATDYACEIRGPAPRR